MSVVQISSINRVSALLAVSAKLAGRRVICRSIGGDAWLLGRLQREGHPLTRLHMWALKSADAIIAQAQSQAQILYDLGIDEAQVTVIHNGVDVSHYRPYEGDRGALRSRLGLPEASKILCWVGGFRPVKRVDVLVEAFGLMAAECPNSILLLVGDGEQEDLLRAMAESQRIAERVRFQGRVNEPLEYLQASDLFVFPSDMETHPNALVEAMACGLPIVATAVGGNKECVRDRVEGLLVPRGDAAKMSQAILEVCMDEALAGRLGSNARKFALENYSVQRMVDRYLEAYGLAQ